MSNRIRKSKYDNIKELNKRILNENVPLTSKCPSGCYCDGSECKKMVINPGSPPTTKKCGKKCTNDNPGKPRPGKYADNTPTEKTPVDVAGRPVSPVGSNSQTPICPTGKYFCDIGWTWNPAGAFNSQAPCVTANAGCIACVEDANRPGFCKHGGCDAPQGNQPCNGNPLQYQPSAPCTSLWCMGGQTGGPTPPPQETTKPKGKLDEGCGCGEQKETSEDSYMAASQLHSISNKAEDMYNRLEKDEVLDDWVESHLAKIDQMMDSVSDSFNHDEYKDAGDMGTGGCPPGHHWCTASNSCRADDAPQTQPITLMGADVVSLNERENIPNPGDDSDGEGAMATNDVDDTKEPVKTIEPSKEDKPSEDKEVDVKALIKKHEPQGKKTEPPMHPAVILGDNEGVIKEQSGGCTAASNPNARKVYFWWVSTGIMPPHPNGLWPGCPPPCNQLPACQPPVMCNWSFGQPMPITAGTPPSAIFQGTWMKAVTVNGQVPQPGDIIDWTTGIRQCNGNSLLLGNTPGNLMGVYAVVQPNFPNAEVIDFGGGTPTTPTPKYAVVEMCDGTTFGSSNPIMNMLVDDNGTVREPVIGDTFSAPLGGPGSVTSTVRITQLLSAAPVPQMTYPIVQCPLIPTGCDQSDFDYNAPCGSQWLVPAPGNQPSWDGWLNQQYNAFNGNAGCYQFGAIQNWIGQQLAAGVYGPNHPTMAGQPYSQMVIDRKQAKLDWAACMQNNCAGGPQSGC